MRRQVHGMQHHVVACRENAAGRQSCTHAPPQGGGASGNAPLGPRTTAYPPQAGAQRGSQPCAGFGLAPQAASPYPAVGDPGRLGAPAPQTPHNPGPAQPRRHPPAPASRAAPWPTRPSPRQNLGATASPAGSPVGAAAGCGPCPLVGARQSRHRGRGCGAAAAASPGIRSPRGPPGPWAHSHVGRQDRQGAVGGGGGGPAGGRGGGGVLPGVGGGCSCRGSGGVWPGVRGASSQG